MLKIYQFKYHGKPCELTNAPGYTAAVLPEYNFIKKDIISRKVFGKLYEQKKVTFVSGGILDGLSFFARSIIGHFSPSIPIEILSLFIFCTSA
jgi:hypothetical protein